MADINKFPVRASSSELIPIPFRAKLDGANNGVIQEGNIAVASLVHAAAGRYTLLLKNRFQEIVSATFAIACDTAEDLVPQVRAPFNANASAGGTMTISLLAAAVETDPPAFVTHNTYLFGMLWVRNTGNAS